MKTSVTWKEGMQLSGVAGTHALTMDAKSPIGKDSGPTPKELVGMAMGGCTAMDVIALLKKHKQPLVSLTVDADIETVTGKHPAVFEKALLTFQVAGEINPEILNEAVMLSQTKFCSVNAMLSKAFPIQYVVILNGKQIGEGTADFESATTT